MYKLKNDMVLISNMVHYLEVIAKHLHYEIGCCDLETLSNQDRGEEERRGCLRRSG